jgi:hypothetical protein
VRCDDYFSHRRDKGNWLIRLELLPTAVTLLLPRAADIAQDTHYHTSTRIYTIPRDDYLATSLSSSASSVNNEARVINNDNIIAMIAPFSTYASSVAYEYHDNPCWMGDAMIMMEHGTYKRIDTLVVGDRVRSPIVNNHEYNNIDCKHCVAPLTHQYNVSTITQVIASTVNETMPMVMHTLIHALCVVNQHSSSSHVQ